MSKLKPCPFCGGEAYISRPMVAWLTGCEVCGFRLRTYGDQLGAVLRWNRRAPTRAQKGEDADG